MESGDAALLRQGSRQIPAKSEKQEAPHKRVAPEYRHKYQKGWFRGKREGVVAPGEDPWEGAGQRGGGCWS